MHANIRVFQIIAQMLRQRLHSRFTRIVRRVPGRIGNALFTPRDDNSGSLIGRASLKGRNICVQTIYHAVEVGVEDLR